MYNTQDKFLGQMKNKQFCLLDPVFSETSGGTYFLYYSYFDTKNTNLRMVKKLASNPCNFCMLKTLVKI